MQRAVFELRQHVAETNHHGASGELKARQHPSALYLEAIERALDQSLPHAAHVDPQETCRSIHRQTVGYELFEVGPTLARRVRVEAKAPSNEHFTFSLRQGATGRFFGDRRKRVIKPGD